VRDGPWWVRDCDSKVTGKVSVGHAELRSSIATLLTFVGMSGMLMNLVTKQVISGVSASFPMCSFTMRLRLGDV